MSKVLGIETTCDETGAAVVEGKRLVLSNIIASQEELHKKYGGIVPEVASRKHLEALPIVVDKALKEAKISIKEIDAIAVSKEPGLPPALSVGYAYASGLAAANEIPLIDVNHLEAHINGIWLIENEKEIKDIQYPYLCLVVSGGHTQIDLVTKEGSFKTLGRTRDDAAGEAFDKVARILGLGYPGGPIIDKLSQEGDEQAYNFPRPMINDDNFDFSFSGLKTSVRRKIVKLEKEMSDHNTSDEVLEELRNNMTRDISASFQESVVDVLVTKTIKAAQELGIENVALAGGVSANSRLRDQMGRVCNNLGYDLHYPELKNCLDNAAMVASRGAEIFKNQ